MRIIFAGGGTGGHLYPGLAIAREIVRLDPRVRPFFVGARRGVESQVLPGTEFEHLLLDLHPLYRSRPWENWKTIVGGIGAWRRIGKLVRAERPALVVGTGGYAAGAMLAYSAVHRIPMVQQAGDSFPGITARFFARFSRAVYLAFPEAAARLTTRNRDSLIFTGAPIEPPPARRPDRAAARASWGLPPGVDTVILVYGGSQGSLAINEAVAGWVEGELPENVGIIWATGRTTHERFAHLDGAADGRVVVRDYLSPIREAYAATDIAIARAGAMTTAELFAWGIPAVLVPLPTAAADHQTRNAVALDAAGAAIHLPQSELSSDRLAATIGRLANDPRELDRLVRGSRARAKPDAAETIARHILDLAAGPSASR
jgi:UDP-N-acetylglucosamine--N-acetylmuramyl-(pentapeptide) pyrophosphoryl-undecaprenol N-acetylglucosamine transferase